MPIEELQQGSDKFNLSVRNILQNCENICQGAVDYDHIEKNIQSCDFLYVNYEPLEVKLIGFGIVFDYGDELYIDVICNLPKNNNKSISNSIYNFFFSQYGGKDIINKIKDKAIAMGKERVGLKALKPVISYYSHLGFTFPNSGHEGRRIAEIQEFKELMDKYKDLEEKRNKIFDKEKDDFEHERTPEEREICKEFKTISNMINVKLWAFYERYQPGRYTEPDLRKSLEENDGFQRIQKIIDLGTNGIKMIFDLSQKKTRSSSSLSKTITRNSSMPRRSRKRSRSSSSSSRGGNNNNSSSNGLEGVFSSTTNKTGVRSKKKRSNRSR